MNIGNNNLINKNKIKTSSTNRLFDFNNKNNANKDIHKYEKNSISHKPKTKRVASSISLRISDKLNSNINYLKNISPKKDKNHLGFEKEKEENSSEKRNKVGRKSLEDINKRKKNQKEMDIISLNIEKSSQNLNQPDEFYADLFSHLIRKNENKNKRNSSFKLWKNKDIDKISERNEIQELDIEEGKI